jgi:hypothetical protein
MAEKAKKGGAIDSNEFKLGKDDAAIIFRQETQDVELIIPGVSVDDGAKASESCIMASWFAFACITDNPAVRRAVRVIIDEYDKSIEEWIKETGKHG